ncbi:unnamed protein product [Caenorhabditis brenneri]
MASKINSAAQDETEIDPLWWKAVDPDFTGQKFLAKLVANVIRQARKDPSRFSSMKKVCQRVFSDMELEKEIFDFVIEDLRCEFRNVADLFECDVSEVKNEFARLFTQLEAAELKAAELEAEASEIPKSLPPEWEDHTTDTTRSIVKSQNYSRKNSRIHFRRSQILDDLVFKEVNLAYKIWNRPVGFFLTDRNVVIDRILGNLRSDGFLIEDLTEWHYRKVAKFYECQRSVVREEFLQQKDELVIKKEEDRTNVDLDDLFDGLPKMFNFDPHNKYTKKDHIRCFLTNLQWFGIDTSELIPGDFEELADLLKLDSSTVETKLFKMKREFEKELEKERETRRLEKTLDALVAKYIRIARYGTSKIEPNSLTKHQFCTRLWRKMRRELLNDLGLKHRHFEDIAQFFNCGILEIMEEFNQLRTTTEPENVGESLRPSKALPSHPEFRGPEDQENHHEEPVAKRAKVVMEPKIEEVKIEDPEPEEEYQMDYYEDQRDHEEEVYDPEFQEQNVHPEDGFSWDYVDGIPAPVDQEEPALSEYDELDPQEMELEEECDEAAELKHPNGSSWEYGDGRQYAVDEDRAYEEAEPEEMDVVQEEQQLARVEQEDELQDIRDMFIGQICLHAEKNFNDQTLTEFKKRSSLRWLFNTLADQDFPMELTDGQFDKVAKSFNCDRDDIESVFAFYKTEKEFLDELDERRPEDQRITDLINEISAEMKPPNGDLNYQNKFLETFYQKSVKNKIKLILNSRQKRRLAAHLGLLVTEVQEQLQKWLIRDDPEEVPAPKKKIMKQSEIVSRPKNPRSKFVKNHSQSKIPKCVQPEKQIRSSSVEIAREESFWGSLAELEPTETIADREAAVKIVEEERKKIEEYILKYRKQIAMPYQPKYISGLSKVVEQFGRANNHATKWMPPPVLEAYRTAFLTILYEEIERELNEKEADEVARFLKMRKKDVDYLRRKERQFVETGRIGMDKVE